MPDEWGIDVSFFIVSQVCCDLLTRCRSSCHSPAAFYWRLPNPCLSGIVAQAQTFQAGSYGSDITGGPDTRIYEVAWYLFDNGSPKTYTTNSKVSIYDDSAGLPGAELASVIITPGDYRLFPLSMRGAPLLCPHAAKTGATPQNRTKRDKNT